MFRCSSYIICTRAPGVSQDLVIRLGGIAGVLVWVVEFFGALTNALGPCRYYRQSPKPGALCQ